MTAQKLKWTQENCRRDDFRQVPVGTLVRRLAEDLQGREEEDRRRAARAAARITDDSFRSHCRIGGIRGRTVVVTVDNAGLVAAMRGQWLRPLLAALEGGLPGKPINRIVFEYGKSGADIVATDRQGLE
ncbi:MAG: DUF721 domain-containing protein [Planctomycetes bacterium]|nr:DUF721 domain-containing protein [Planctomycetota bacterium]